MGIRSRLDPVCSITLGTQGVNALEMTNAYATLAANGTRRWATPIAKVESATGGVVYRHKAGGEQVLDRNDAATATYALEGVINGGTGTNADIGRPAAGKTGTAQDYKDAWFCGYVPQLATCVWVGYREEEKPLENVEGFSAVYGGTIPALIWHDFMTVATQGMEVRDFPEPSFAGYTGQAPTPPPATHTEEPTVEPEPTDEPEPTETQSPSPPPTGPSPSPPPSPSAPAKPDPGG
jgi:membrane peptidoglycan carboxypeptidase